MSLLSLDKTTPTLVDESTNFVANSAELIGKVKLEVYANIWFQAVLRGDNEYITIGENSNVQDGCILHNDIGFPLTIGKNCTIGHKAIIHGCIIEDNCLIGMGSTILNGARIGKNSIIGAGALIPENKIIPENSLVIGMPGRVVRTLGDDEVKGIAQSAAHYVENAKRYIEGLEV